MKPSFIAVSNSGWLFGLWCAVAAPQVQYEMKSRFPDHATMDALGVVYPQFWAQGASAQVSFSKHLDVLKQYYCEPKYIQTTEGQRLIPPVLDQWKLDTQQGMFKTAMMSNWERAMEPPFDLNPLTRLWRLLNANSLTNHLFPEYVKLAEIAVVHVLGSVEDERCFSSLGFLKNKVRNSLDEHLPLVVTMFSLIYSLRTFPYDATYNMWSERAKKNGRQMEG